MWMLFFKKMTLRVVAFEYVSNPILIALPLSGSRVGQLFTRDSGKDQSIKTIEKKSVCDSIYFYFTLALSFWEA